MADIFDTEVVTLKSPRARTYEGRPLQALWCRPIASKGEKVATARHHRMRSAMNGANRRSRSERAAAAYP